MNTRKLVDQIHVDAKVRDYIVQLVFATRKPEKYKAGLETPHPVRRLAARDNLPDGGRKGVGVVARP